jgi:type VI secretion system protein ImpH
VGREADALAFLSDLAEAPHRYDFYQVLRRLECLYDAPRWGEARRPVDEPVRLGQEPDLAFAPAPLAALESQGDGRPPRLLVRLFGLLGPNGPLPLHLTEYARERLRRHPGDPTFARFLDLFHHRFTALFYRAWAQAQPHVNRDRPESDRFMLYVGAFAGLGPASLRRRDRVSDLAKYFHAGAIVGQPRHPQGLATILRHYFRVPARVEEFVGAWLPLRAADRMRLGRPGPALGAGATLGARVWDRQYTFRVHLGPLTLAEFERFLPASARDRHPGPGGALEQIVDWVRLHGGRELGWDLRLHLRAGEVPALRLGAGGRLGWTSWLGRRRTTTDAGDLRLDAERIVDAPGVAHAS